MKNFNWSRGWLYNQLLTTLCLFQKSFNHSKIIARDLSKQQALDADSKAIQKINFTENLDRIEHTSVFQKHVFLYWRSKRKDFRFFGKKCKLILK